jgi:hypothetical protein
MRRSLLILAALLVASGTDPRAAGASSFVLRSGTVPPTQTDPAITYLLGPAGCGVGFAAAFSAADFAAADAGPNAWSVPNHFAWFESLTCDPLANWISIDASWSPRSVLYSMSFVLPTDCCFLSATLNFCWGADDRLGDHEVGAPNPAGVYVNGVPVPAIAGGNFGAESQVFGADITSLVHCGVNHLYVYNRDVGCAIAGAIFSARILVEDCPPTPVEPTTWGVIKGLYR